MACCFFLTCRASSQVWVHHRPVGLKPLGTNGKGWVAGRGGGYGGLLFEDIELELLKDDLAKALMISQSNCGRRC